MKKGMTRERKKKIAKAKQLRPFLGVDMCACCPLMKCKGVCREAHRNDAGEVVCFEKYQIDPALIILKEKDKRRGRRVDKTDTQEHNDEKHRRRDKIQRNREGGM